MGFRAGTPVPDIGTVAAFKVAMLDARKVAIINPASGGSSGVYVEKLFRTMGIAEAMAPKLVLVHDGLAAEAAADGRADLVVHQISEIVAVPGVAMVGPLPGEIQSETVYAGAVGTGSAAPDVARAFLEVLSGLDMRPVLLAKGMMSP